MVRVGEAPYLECSSRGDTRFSAFYARPRSCGGRSIEDVYQALKMFEDGSTGLNWRQAKGRKAVNHVHCANEYLAMWAEWIDQEDLLPVLQAASGLSDMFGKPGSVCQALVLWDIRGDG